MIIKFLIIFFLSLSPALAQVADSLKSDSLKIEKLHETEKLMWKQTEQQKIDSLIKSQLKTEIELAQKDTKRKEELEIRLRNIEISDSIRNAEQMEKIRELKKYAKGFAVTPFSDTVFVIFTRIGSSSPSERAQAITHKIRKLYGNDMFNKDSLIMIKNESGYDIAYKDEIIMSVTEYDSKWYNENPEKIAGTCLTKIRDSVLQEKEKMSFTNILKRIGLAVLVILIIGILMYLINILFRRSAKLITESRKTFFSGIKIGNINILNPDQHKKFFLKINFILRFIVKLIVIYISLPVLFSIFPSTKSYAETLISWVLTPAGKIVNGIIDFLPNLVTIAVIFLFTHYAIKSLKYFADEIESGNVSLKGFYRDWSKPTFNILKFILYAFMMVLIFPYLPGSESDAFKGVSVFIGILFSFGSTSAITNIVAGLVITYMRAFQIGDIIKIGDVMGIVMEKTLLVTRIKTIKNEDISIPNSTVLSSHTVNYTANSKNPGLIIHTTVTIGYDVPWKKMHEALINAALRTELILKEPKPFVLQTSLDDFYVSYQINAYTQAADKQAVVYSDLHANIQDCCNEAGIEIMSPHYRNMRDGNMTTIPADYLPKDYVPPAFNVKDIKSENKE
ncbi:MAG TPA: mechanosensitive ion channel family protein [Ignavibacteria bacterium]|nr:mechanosensitive ion channel family protein [Ignavibacteria bacterium]